MWFFDFVGFFIFPQKTIFCGNMIFLFSVLSLCIWCCPRFPNRIKLGQEDTHTWKTPSNVLAPSWSRLRTCTSRSPYSPSLVARLPRPPLARTIQWPKAYTPRFVDHSPWVTPLVPLLLLGVGAAYPPWCVTTPTPPLAWLLERL